MHILRRILDLILPTSCAFCNEPVNDSGIARFCSSCWKDFTPLQAPLCPRCGRPFGSPEALAHSPEHECRACRLAPPTFDQALSAGYFEGPLREAIHQFKYRPCRSLGRPLGAWMADKVRLISGLDMVMPVPLHTKRLRQRGFNQALLLAHPMSKRHGLPLVCDNLVRVRPTRPQVELSGEERVKNVAGAFALQRPGLVIDKRILLIDDVFTTGATLNECASVLRSTGAAQVIVFTLARAV
jgi:ComF family protein